MVICDIVHNSFDVNESLNENKMKIGEKFFLAAVAIAIVPIISGLLVLSNTIQVVEKSNLESLEQIALLKEHTLELFIDETISAGEFFQKSDVIQAYVRSLTGEINGEAIDAATNLLYSFQETNWGKYHHVFVIDHTNRIVLSPNHGDLVKGSPSSHLGEDTSDNEWARKALREGVVTVSDYSSWSESDHSHQMVFVPLKDSSGETVAAVGFELQIPYILELLSEDIELGESGRVLLISDEGVSITSALPENQMSILSPGIRIALAEGDFTGPTKNEKGELIIGTYHHHETEPWILGVEIDESEAFKVLVTIKRFFFLSLIVSVILILILTLIFVSQLVKPIKQLTKVAQSISAGNLKVRAEIASTDELGIMASAYNKMIDTVTKSHTELEKKVEERTHGLTKATKDLIVANEDVQRMNKSMIGREQRMIELKDEIEKLKGTK